MSSRVSAQVVFSNLLVLFMLALVAAGCGVQTSPSDRPDWSLNGPKPAPQPAKTYGDWNGPGAPKPLMYDSVR